MTGRLDEPQSNLPPDISEFTGRHQDLGRLRGLLPAPNALPVAPVVAMVHGPPGIGKSVLAIHFAREIESQFPDVQLYVDLRGASATPLEPMGPAEALGRMLQALGVRGPDLPDVDGLTRVYRRSLDGKRAIVVLDNAASLAQVLPLLPNSPTCLTIVTSRQPLAELIGFSGARQRLDVMSHRDAVALLGKIADEQAVTGENAAAAERLARLCGHLPLALSIAGVHLRSHPIGDVVTRLEDEQSRLKELHAGNVGVRASFDVTYGLLEARERTLFRRLRLLPEPTFDTEMARILLDCPTRQAQDALDGLVEEQVLERIGVGEYGFNDLIGLYAQEKLDQEEPPHERRAACQRALQVYLLEATTRSAVVDVAILELGGVPVPPSAVTLEGQVASLDWFERERPRLIRVWRRADEIGAHDVICRLATCLAPFFDVRGHHQDWAELQDAALKAARESGDLRAAAWARLGLGHLRWLQRRRDDALGDLEEALESAQAGKWPRLQARALHLMGRVEHENGQLDGALVRYNRAAAIFHEEGMLHEQASTIFYTGMALADLGAIPGEEVVRLGELVLTALGVLPQDLWVVRTIGRIKEALGRVTEGLDDREAAGAYYIGSRQAFWTIGFRRGQARAIHRLVRMRKAQGRQAIAEEYFNEGLTLYRAIGDHESAEELRALLARPTS